MERRLLYPNTQFCLAKLLENFLDKLDVFRFSPRMDQDFIYVGNNTFVKPITVDGLHYWL